VVIIIVVKPHGLLVLVSLGCYHPYTPSLSTRWSTGGLQGYCYPGDLVLRWVSRLDAFSGYPDRT